MSRVRELGLPHKAVLVAFMLVALIFIADRCTPKVSGGFVPDQVIVLGDPEHIDDVIRRALPGAVVLSSIDAICPIEVPLDPTPVSDPPTTSSEPADSADAIDSEDSVADESTASTIEASDVITATELPAPDEERNDEPDIEIPIDLDVPYDEALAAFEYRLLDVSRVEFSDTITRSKGIHRAEARVWDSVQSVAIESIKTGQDVGSPVSVIAHPNYITSILRIKGSPLTGPAPIGPLSVSNPVAQGLFNNQWAFEQIELTPDPTNTGAGVDIGIFDTVPFPVGTKTAVIDWANPSFNMAVVEPMPTPDLDENNESIDLDLTVDEQIEISQHGLFVASLINGVAPDADLYLHRALTDDGYGDLYWLLFGIHQFLENRALTTGTPKKVSTPTIINLSLGLQCSHLDDVPEAVRTQVSSLSETIATAHPSLSFDTTSCGTHDLTGVHAPFALARQMGVLVVAASGNDSYTESVPLAMEVPALFEDVIGVAASDSSGDESCFSNQGQMMAPGGNAEVGAVCTPEFTANSCYEAQATAMAGDPTAVPAGCDDALIGLVRDHMASYDLDPNPLVTKNVSYDYDNGHAFWLGTSFAAPLVTGLAALMLENPGDFDADDPLEAEKRIYCEEDVNYDLMTMKQPSSTNPFPGSVININSSVDCEE